MLCQPAVSHRQPVGRGRHQAGTRGFPLLERPFGPLLVPAEFVTDPHDLRILLRLNGQAMQDESTADMIVDIARQIEYVSTYAELWPGDLITTGSPAGNGTHYGRFLRDGDVIDATITGLGAQHNRCVGTP